MEPPAPEYEPMRLDLPEAEPNPSIPRTIGTLNIIFGSLLLLCAICSGLNLAMQSAMAPMMGVQQKQMQQAIEAERQAELRKLEEREKAARDPKEKAELQNQQKILKAQPVPKMPDMSKFMRDSRLQVYTLTDVVTGLIFNTLMIISGIGLMRLKEWGRVMALWVTALKIVRLVALYGVFAMVIGPIWAQQMVGMFKEMAEAAPLGQQPGPGQFDQMATAIVIAMTVGSIAMIVIGSIYPAIVLILLTRPRVKAACNGAAITQEP